MGIMRRGWSRSPKRNILRPSVEAVKNFVSPGASPGLETRSDDAAILCRLDALRGPGARAHGAAPRP